MGKKIIVILLSVVMILSLGACGVKKNLNEKIAEKVTEGVLEKVTGGGTDIDIDGDKLTIKGEDGEEFSFGGGEWPVGGAADIAPKLNKGNVVSVMNSDTGCLIIIEEVEEEDYKEYVEELKDAGFTNNKAEFSSEESMSYFANSNEETAVAVSYGAYDKVISISLQINE